MKVYAAALLFCTCTFEYARKDANLLGAGLAFRKTRAKVLVGILVAGLAEEIHDKI